MDRAAAAAFRRTLRRWLPPSLQAHLRRAQSALYRRRFRGALALPLIEANPAAPVEIHTLLCRRDVLAYLYAVKSLLFYSSNFSVVVHDDGTLTNSDLAILRRHLPGIRIIGRAEGDAAVIPALRSFPVLTSYRQAIPNARQFLDFTLLSGASRLISLDADVLFLERPVEVLNWAAGQSPTVLVGHEKDWESEQDRRLDRTALAYFPNINIGLMCFPRELLRLDRAEQILQAFGGTPDWWTGQAAIAVLIQDYARQNPAQAQYLDGDRYIHNTRLDRPAVMKHYWAVRRHRTGWSNYREDLNKVCLEQT